MPRVGMRFRPPRVDWTPELRWVLLRAFGPAGRPKPTGIVGAGAVDLALRLDLAPRIGLRVPFATLRAELGVDAARGLALESVSAEAVVARQQSFAQFIAEVAAEPGLPVVFLKGVGLHLAGVVRPGARWVGDIDVLTAGERAGELQAELVRRDLRQENLPGSEHQLPPLAAAGGEVVEVHRRILGLRVAESGRWATMEEMHAHGVLVRLDGFPGAAYVPNRELLLAHALVHGIAQHGLSPLSYPATRMLADVADLLGRGDSGAPSFAEAHRRIAAEVSEVEVEAVESAVRALVEGDAACFTEEWGASPAGLLLRHAVAGALDRDYGRSLRLAAVILHPTERSRPLAWLRQAWHTVVLTRSQVDIIYGPPRRRLGYVGRRLLRPFDLAWRLLRTGKAAAAIAVGRRSGSRQWTHRD